MAMAVDMNVKGLERITKEQADELFRIKIDHREMLAFAGAIFGGGFLAFGVTDYKTAKTLTSIVEIGTSLTSLMGAGITWAYNSQLLKDYLLDPTKVMLRYGKLIKD